MLKWLIWAIWGPPDYVQRPIRALERRLEALNDDLTHLGNRLEKLQGRLTGGLRRPAGDRDTNGDGEPAQLEQVDLNEFIRQGGRPSVRIPENHR